VRLLADDVGESHLYTRDDEVEPLRMYEAAAGADSRKHGSCRFSLTRRHWGPVRDSLLAPTADVAPLLSPE